MSPLWSQGWKKLMKNTLLTFGLISGVLCALMAVATAPIAAKIGFNLAEVVSYAIILLSLLLVFFGIRSYRDNVCHGDITFARAVGVGISITLITCICYVVTWEILYFTFMHDFMNKYGVYIIEKARAAGASPTALHAQVQHLQQYKEQYDNPLFNAAVTFFQPFPIGLVVALFSATVLRKKAPSTLAHSPLPASC